MAFYMRSPVYTPNDPVKSVKQLHSWLYQLNENLKFMFSNLDSDNFTSEFASCFSEETARKTQEEIKKLDEAVGALSTSGEWETLDLVGFIARNPQTAPAVLHLGGHAFVTGEASLLYPLSGSVARPLARLPERLRPRKKQEFFCRSGLYLLIAIIREDGEISIFNPMEETLAENTLVSVSFSYGL